MYRRSLACMAKRQTSATGRTIVRDPRRKKKKPRQAAGSAAASAQLQTQEEHPAAPVPPPPPPPRPAPLPFAPSRENQQTIGSTLVAYGIAGMAVSLGVGLVRFFIG